MYVMNPRRWWPVFIVLTLCLRGMAADKPDATTQPAPAPAAAAATTQPTKFVRFIEDGLDAGRLETAIVTYTNDKGVKIELVAAVHLADAAYYAKLNKLFAGYDVLLYEMVKEAGAEPPVPGEAPRSTIGALQRMMQNALELQFQLDGIDYTAKNFVHADMDVESFFKAQDERGESMLTLMLRSALHTMSRPEAMANQPTGEEILFALLSPDRSHQLKLIMARQFENVEETVASLEGPDGSVILTERNKAALAVLEDMIEQGHKHIGIFYGAAHMSDLEERLSGMGFKLAGLTWETAWDIRSMAPTTLPTTQPARS